MVEEAMPGLEALPTAARNAWIAVAVAALRWPDTALPNKLILSLENLDVSEPARNFRQLPPEVIDQPSDDVFHGKPAQWYIERSEASDRGHTIAADILKETVKEQQRGLTGPLVDRQHFHRMYGQGQWRPLPRRVVYRKEECRPVDDGGAGGHNAAAKLREVTIMQRGTWLLPLVKSFGCRIAKLQSLTPKGMQRAAWPHWPCVLADLEGRWKEYRQNHVQDEHSRASATRQGCALPFAVEPSTRQKSLDTIDECGQVGRDTPGDAGTTRGLMTWIDNFVTGKPCRGAPTAVEARQYYERVMRDPGTDKLGWASELIRIAAAHMPHRFVPVAPLAKRPAMSYTDASEEDSSPVSLTKVSVLIITADQTTC